MVIPKKSWCYLIGAHVWVTVWPGSRRSSAFLTCTRCGEPGWILP